MTGTAFESMAIAAFRAGRPTLGERLIALARQTPPEQRQPDATLELAIAEAEALQARGATGQAARGLTQVLPLPAQGISLRAQCLLFEKLADLQQQLRHTTRALEHLRTWQRLHVERARLASQARYQAASLETELLRLRLERDEIDARRRSTERAKRELEAINQQLSQKVNEVQALQAELKQQAVRDALTGLFNRRHLNDVLASMVALAERDRVPLAVVIIDLDHFKAVNDRHGHLAGDLVLRRFGELLTRRVRRSDIACRFGGEEFCLLMPRTDARLAQRKIEALLKEWRATVVPVDSDSVRGLTFSAGIADSRLAAQTPEHLLDAADRCALEAKRLGRNRVVRADALVRAA